MLQLLAPRAFAYCPNYLHRTLLQLLASAVPVLDCTRRSRPLRYQQFSNVTRVVSYLKEQRGAEVAVLQTDFVASRERDRSIMVIVTIISVLTIKQGKQPPEPSKSKESNGVKTAASSSALK